MPELEIGNLKLETQKRRLRIVNQADGQEITTLEEEQVEELIDFIVSLSYSEFNRRRSFRVPVKDASGLLVEMEKDGKQIPVRARDISVTGICIENNFCPGDELKLEDEVVVQLEFEGNVDTIAGVVKRLEYETVGILFPDCLRGETIEPPEEIRRLVMQLQRRWIARDALHRRGLLNDG
ncbi:MAG: PilZ domain-containing protein [Pirellulaceae bacterium]